MKTSKILQDKVCAYKRAQKDLQENIKTNIQILCNNCTSTFEYNRFTKKVGFIVDFSLDGETYRWVLPESPSADFLCKRLNKVEIEFLSKALLLREDWDALYDFLKNELTEKTVHQILSDIETVEHERRNK